MFKEKKYQEAHDKYTEGLALAKNNKHISAILHSNRAAALIKLDKKTEALKDLNEATSKNPLYIKPFLKRATLH